MNDAYGFIYITTNLVNCKKYLGQKKFDYRYKSYLGSGKAFKKAVLKYGKENFKRDIIQVCYSPEELNQAEYDWSKALNVVEDANWYNEVYGGKKMYGYHPSEESRLKNAESHKGKYPSKETLLNLSEIRKGREAWNKGVSHTEEAKRKMSEARKGKCGVNHNRSKQVTRANNYTSMTFGSVREASRETNINRSTIQYYIVNKKRDKEGFLWRYDSEVRVHG